MISTSVLILSVLILSYPFLHTSVPQDYVDYAKKDAHGIVREDLLLTMSERLNHVTKVMEDLGLVILKDENGKYVARGNRNIKINGENMKPILAKAAAEQENVTVLILSYPFLHTNVPTS